MRILLTGASGFLGNVIRRVLSGQDVFSLGRHNADIECNLAISEPTLPLVQLVIHAAGKAHSVPTTEQEAQKFYDTNVNGTKNLLSALSKCNTLPNSFVFISSVAVYGQDSGEQINEGFSLLATDPYGRSKIMAESLVQQWCDENKVVCSILRLPLLAAPNPPGNLGSMIHGISKGYYLNIAGGLARKSIVLAEDVAALIPRVAEIGGTYNLTDGYNPSFYELSSHISNQLRLKAPLSMPKWLAHFVAKIGDIIGERAPINTNRLRKLMFDLTFDDSKARKMLDWSPNKVLDNFKIQ